jgi:hypothetical protein
LLLISTYFLRRKDGEDMKTKAMALIMCIGLLALLMACASSGPAGKSGITASMAATKDTAAQIREQCNSRHGESGLDFGRCMAKTYESIGAFARAGIWYQGFDEKKAKEMALRQADKYMKNGDYINAAFSYQTFDQSEKAKTAWIGQAEKLEKKRQWLKAAAIYEGERVNEPDRAKNAYFQLAEELAGQANKYKQSIRDKIYEEAAKWYEEADRDDKAKEMRRKISAIAI